jgi:hypothetical protein
LLLLYLFCRAFYSENRAGHGLPQPASRDTD